MDGSAPPAAHSAAITAAGDSLYRRHHHWLRAVLGKRFGHDWAEEVAAETYLRAAPHEAAGEVRHPRAFLLRVARNLIIDRVRQGQVEAASEPLDDVLETLRPTPASQVEAVTFKQILLALPPELRDVFCLSHIEGQTYQEIAVTLGIPATTVHHRMRQALALTAAAMRD